MPRNFLIIRMVEGGLYPPPLFRVRVANQTGASTALTNLKANFSELFDGSRYRAVYEVNSFDTTGERTETVLEET